MSATIHAVRIRNFQSLADVSVELGGFTVIVGPSSSGKSAFTRALKTLVSNRRGTEWITHGERVSSITAETSHGSVTLTRSKTTSSNENAYTITPMGDPDGRQVYAKLGGETPEDVSRFLGIPSGNAINWAGQFDKPFLLDESAGEVARTLGALTNVSVIFDGARESNRRKLSASNTLKMRAQDLAAVKERIPEFRALKAQDAALVRAEEKIARAREVQHRISRLENALGIVEVVEPAIARLTQQAQLEVPDEKRLVQAQEALRRFEQAVGRVPALAAAQKAADAAYEAAERAEAQALENFSVLAGEITRDVRSFVDAKIDPVFVEDGRVEIGHVVGIFVEFLETRAGS